MAGAASAHLAKVPEGRVSDGFAWADVHRGGRLRVAPAPPHKAADGCCHPRQYQEAQNGACADMAAFMMHLRALGLCKQNLQSACLARCRAPIVAKSSDGYRWRVVSVQSNCAPHAAPDCVMLYLPSGRACVTNNHQAYWQLWDFE